MERKHKEQFFAVFVVILVVGAVVFQLIREGEWSHLIELGSVTFMAAGIWFLFFKSTRCGYQTYQQLPCRHPVRGALRGCKQAHKGLKMEAIFNHFGLTHPRQWMQGFWMRHESNKEDEEVGQLKRPVLDLVALCATIFSAITSVAMPVIQMAIGA